MQKLELEWNLSLENYRNYNALNQSLLKSLPASLNIETSDDDPSVAFSIGSYMEDCIYFDREYVSNKYYTNKTKIPDAPIKNIIQNIVQQNLDWTDDESISNVGVNHNYQPKYGHEARAKAIRKYKDYYDLVLILQDGKKPIIALDDAMVATQMADSIKKNSWTNQYCTDNNDWITYNNVPIAVDDNETGEELKILIDLLQVNHTSKRVRVIDIKSTGDYLSAFPKSVLRFRYDVQGSFYRYVLNIFMSYHPILKDYTLDENFYFIVASTKEPTKSLSYYLNANDLLCAKEGGELNGEKRFKVKGWSEMIDNYQWYKSNMLSEYTREQYEYINKNESIPLLLYENKI